MKVRKLKPGVKVGLYYIGLCLIVAVSLIIYMNKVNAINSGSIRVVPESEMKERN